MSAPESGRTFTVACPLREDMCTLDCGGWFEGQRCHGRCHRDNSCPGVKGVRGGDGFCGASVRGSRRLRQALAKWPIF